MFLSPPDGAHGWPVGLDSGQGLPGKFKDSPAETIVAVPPSGRILEPGTVRPLAPGLASPSTGGARRTRGRSPATFRRQETGDRTRMEDRVSAAETRRVVASGAHGRGRGCAGPAAGSWSAGALASKISGAAWATCPLV
jgi:hypothetical protein